MIEDNKKQVEYNLTKEEERANKLALNTHAIKLDRQYNLDFFCNASSDKKIQPNDIVRSALWSVQTTVEREYVKNLPIYSSNPTLNIFYTGEDLQAATDEKIWMMLITHASKVDFGKKVQIQISQICEELGWQASGHYYSTIWASLERLHYAGLKIKKGKNRVLAFIRMLNLHSVKGDNVQDNGTVEYSLDNELHGWLLLVAGHTTTLLENHAVRTLKPIEWTLYKWMRSHKEPKPYNIYEFHKHCRSTALLETPQHLASWRRHVRKAIEKLIAGGFITSGTIKNDHIFIARF